MIRKIIHIDEEKCNGCGACVHLPHADVVGMGQPLQLPLQALA